MSIKNVIFSESAKLFIPATYVAGYTTMPDPLRLAGFVVIAMQGVYWGFKIIDYLKEKKNSKQDETISSGGGGGGGNVGST